jgi:competence protein ComEC
VALPAAAAVAGILCARATDFRPAAFLALSIAVLVVGAVLLSLKFVRTAAVGAVLAVALAAGYGASLDLVRPADSMGAAVSAGSTGGGQILAFEGRVLERPVQVPTEEDALRRYVVEIRRAGIDPANLPAASGRVLLYAAADLPRGAGIDGKALFYPLPKAANPGQFDYGDYLRRRGIVAVARAPLEGLIERKSQASRDAVGRMVAALRTSLYERLHGLGLSEGGVIPAVLIGERSLLPDDTREAFVRSGTMHLLAISGLHLAVVVGFVWWLLRLAGVSLRGASVVAIAAAVAYAFVAGGRPPVVRAALMAGFIFLAMMTGRRRHILSVLSAAALVMLLWRPLDLFDAGFQMSFAAVLSLYYLGAPLSRGLPAFFGLARRPAARAPSAGRWARPILVTLGWSLGAWLGAMPLAVWHFHIVAPVSPLANLLLIPVTSVMVVAGFAATAASFLSAGLAAVLALSAAGAQMTLEAAARLLARLPGAYVYVPAFSRVWVVLAYVFLGWTAFAAAAGRRVRWLVVFGLVAANALLWPAALASGPGAPRIQTLVDRNGAAAILFDGEGNVVVFAGSRGGADFGTYTICPFLIAHGSAKVDVLVESADADARLAEAIAARLPLGRVLRQRRFAGAQPSTNRKRVDLFDPGDVAEIFGSVRMTFHSPPPRDFAEPRRPYFRGLVTEIEVKGRRLLVAADVTTGCLRSMTRRLGPSAGSGRAGADLLVVLSPARDAPPDALSSRFRPALTVVADPADADSRATQVVIKKQGR